MILLTMPRVLITGGNGFLGSNLVRFFLKKGYTIAVISRSCSNLADVLDSIHFIKHSSPGYSHFSEEIRTFNPTIVIHCAWDGGNSYKDINSSKQASNLLYGVELLDIICSLPSKPRFVGFGTFAEYGMLTSQASETMTDAPFNLYGQTKSCFKSISKMICNQHGICWTWIRPCYIYGPVDVPTRFIPSVISKLSSGEPLVLDSCTTIIDYLHVNDFCSGIEHILYKEADGVFNVCSGLEYQTRDIVKRIQCLTGGDLVTFDATRDRVNSSKYTCGNPSKLFALGWVPSITLDTGLEHLVNASNVSKS